MLGHWDPDYDFPATNKARDPRLEFGLGRRHAIWAQGAAAQPSPQPNGYLAYIHPNRWYI